MGSARGCVAACLLIAGCPQDEQAEIVPPHGDGGCVPECTGQGMVSGGGDETGDDDFVCGEKSVDVVLGIPRLVFVLDRSGSMGSAWDHDADPSTPETTRWAVLHEVAGGVVDELDGEIELGLVLFPAEDLGCSVAEAPEVAVGPMTGAEILAALPPADEPPIMGDTPTVDALSLSFEHLRSLPSEAARALLIVTDGEPTCGQTLAQATALVADALAEDAITTYAVGLAVPEWAVPGFEGLSEAGGAPAGGATAFYDATTQAELLAALHEVVEGLQPCSVALDPEPELPELLQLYLDGQIVSPVDDCETEDGWVWAHEGGPFDRLILCGDACAAAQAGDAELVADYACPGVTPGP